MLESINDLPAHVFFVHAPVVLVPLIALAAIVTALRPRWRVIYAPLIAIATLMAFVATFLAKESGEEFDELLAGQVNVDDHETLGDQTLLLVFLLLLVTTAAAIVSRRSRGTNSSQSIGEPNSEGVSTTGETSAKQPVAPSTANNVLSVATVVLSVLATLWMIRTGDEGAKLVWDGVVPTSN